MNNYEKTEQKKLLSRLFSPFTYVAGWQALFIGLAAMLAAGCIGSFSNAHFDGVLDFHVGTPAPLWFFLSAGIINWLCMGFVLLVFGKIASKTSFRTIDVFGTQAMARWPTVIMAALALSGIMTRFNYYLMWKLTGQGQPVELSQTDMVILGITIVVMLLVFCWMIRLMYTGYKISCNVKGGKAVGTFIAGIIIAEIISKVVLIILLGMTECTMNEAPEINNAEQTAVQSAEAILKLIDDEKYAESWEDASAFFQKAVTKEQWVTAMNTTRKPLGKMISRELADTTYMTCLPNAPQGEYVVIQFKTSFENKNSAIETITPMLDDDDQWKMSGYYIK